MSEESITKLSFLCESVYYLRKNLSRTRFSNLTSYSYIWYLFPTFYDLQKRKRRICQVIDIVNILSNGATKQ